MKTPYTVDTTDHNAMVDATVRNIRARFKSVGRPLKDVLHILQRERDQAARYAAECKDGGEAQKRRLAEVAGYDAVIREASNR